MSITSKEALEVLASRYYQLYLSPAEGKSRSAEYQRIVTEGGIPDGFTAPPASFPQGFAASAGDRLFTVRTPAGDVEAVLVHNRADFERLVQILVHKCEPVAIPKTMGACTVMGLTNWRKIEAHKAAFLADGKPEFLWSAEFAAFTADKANYQDRLIIVSAGAYSAVPASALHLEENEWLSASLRIRLYHECAHIVCRARFSGKKHAVWDELLADCIGLCAAFGGYDRTRALRLLGIEGERYIGGRLENYLAAGERIADVLPAVLAWTDFLAQAVQDAARHKSDVLQNEALFALCLSLETEFWNEVYHGN